jgi:hypothetical protein
MARAVNTSLTTTTETKPGVYTSEFWAMLVGNILGIVQMILGPVNVSDNRVALVMAIITGLYQASRGLAKAGVKP